MTPRRCTTAPVVEHRRLTNEWSSAKPVAQITASRRQLAAVGERHLVPCAALGAARRWMPCRRRAARGLEPISVSRSLHAAGRAASRPSRASAGRLRDSGTGRGRGCAAAAASAAPRSTRCTSCDARELLGDLIAGVAAADDEHRPAGDRPASGSRCCGAARRSGSRCSAIGRHARHLERPRGDHDLVGLVRCGRRARRGSRRRRAPARRGRGCRARRAARSAARSRVR